MASVPHDSQPRNFCIFFPCTFTPFFSLACYLGGANPKRLVASVELYIFSRDTAPRILAVISPQRRLCFSASSLIYRRNGPPPYPTLPTLSVLPSSFNLVFPALPFFANTPFVLLPVVGPPFACAPSFDLFPAHSPAVSLTVSHPLPSIFEDKTTAPFSRQRWQPPSLRHPLGQCSPCRDTTSTCLHGSEPTC